MNHRNQHHRQYHHHHKQGVCFCFFIILIVTTYLSVLEFKSSTWPIIFLVENLTRKKIRWRNNFQLLQHYMCTVCRDIIHMRKTLKHMAWVLNLFIYLRFKNTKILNRSSHINCVCVYKIKREKKHIKSQKPTEQETATATTSKITSDFNLKAVICWRY